MNLAATMARAVSLASFILVGVGFAQETPGPRLQDPTGSQAAQARLQRAHAGYQFFLAQAEGRWFAHFDERGGSPLIIAGSGLTLLDGRADTLEHAREVAVLALERFEELWGVPVSELFLESEVEAANLFHFSWQQWHAGLEVRGARVRIQVSKAGPVAALGTTAVAIPLDLPLVPALSAEDARAIVARGKSLAVADECLVSNPLIHVRRWGGSSTPRLAYLVDVLQRSQELYERVYVDAIDGAILLVEPGAFSGDVYGSVSGKANATISGLGQPQYKSLEGIDVTIPSVAVIPTDPFGNYFVTTALPGPFLIDAGLAGPNFSVVNVAGPEAVPAKFTRFQSGVYQETLLQFNDSPTEFETSQVTAAYLHNLSRHYADDKVMGFDPTANQVVGVNYLTVSFTPCNGVFLPATEELHFARASTAGVSCQNMCFSSFFEHEFGHFVDHEAGGIADPALSEALGDTFAMYATAQPRVGRDYDGVGTYVRTGENDVSWPPICQSSAESHCVGQPFMGFAWVGRERLVAALGSVPGVAAAENAFFGVFTADSQDIPAAVHQVFVSDDNDGNLLNGTPNYVVLSEVALEKGFTPPAVDLISMSHTPHPDTWNQTQSLDIYATVASTALTTAVISQVRLDFDAGAGVASVVMSPTGQPNQWKGSIPAHVGPALITYRIRAENSDLYTRVLPSQGGSHVIAVGKKTALLSTTFETGSTGWTHGGGNDDWEFGALASTGFFDPPTAFSGTQAWGNDLGLMGTDGTHAAGASSFLSSPAFDASAVAGVRLRYRRWLTVDDSPDDATIHVDGTEIFSSQGQPQGFLDHEWVLHDLSAGSGLSASSKIEWRLASNQGYHGGGWNVDDVEIYGLESTPVLDLSVTPSTTTPAIGTTLQITLQSTSGGNWVLYLATTPGPTTLAGYGVLGVGSGASVIASGTLGASGSTVLNYPIPNNPALVGTSLYSIGLIAPSGGRPQISNAIAVQIQ